MGSSRQSKVVYEGEVLIADFEMDDLEELENELSEFINLEEGEELFVSGEPGGRLEVRKLREK